MKSGALNMCNCPFITVLQARSAVTFGKVIATEEEIPEFFYPSGLRAAFEINILGKTSQVT